MAVQGALTTGFAASAALPATIDETGYDALGFSECGEVTNVGEFGREYNVVPVMNLATGATRKFKGSFNNGSVQVDLLFDSADSGQTILEEAETSINKYAFRVELPGSEQFYFQALVTMLKRIVGGADDAIMLRATLEIDHEYIIEGSV